MSEKRQVLATLPVSEIKVPRLRDGDYQREPDEPRIAKMVREFDPLRLGVLEVAEVSGKYWVWDGQHRLLALRRLGQDVAPCRVSYGYSSEELADAFRMQGPGRRNVAAQDAFRASLAAKDGLYLAAMELLTHEGYRLDLSRTSNNGNGNDRELHCHGSIVGVMRKGLPLLASSLRVMHRGWPTALVFQGTTLTALGLFIERYQERAPSPVGERDYFERRLISVLSTSPETVLIGKGRALTVNTSVNRTTQIVVALKDLYDRGLRGYKLP